MSENVLYMRDEGTNESDEVNEWDDTVLIAAYDKAVHLAKEKIAEKMVLEKSSENQQTPSAHGGNKPETVSSGQSKQKWKVGNNVRVEYSGDGREYEAVIKMINRDGTCTVKYIGYGNEEVVELDDLQASKGKEAQHAQKIEAQEVKTYDEERTREYKSGSIRESSFIQQQIPPPPPPFVMASLPRNESDALSAMLMSWYMSGYHTGYYQGLTSSKTSKRPYKYSNGQ